MTTPGLHISESPERVTSQEKITGESKIASEPRIGEHPVDKEKEVKPESDLRHHICLGADCKETKSQPPESDLRHHICLGGNCPCPPGQTATKGGCVASGGTNANNNYVETPCGPGTVWNGTACATTSTCPVGEIWNGSACIPYGRECMAGEVWDGTRCVNQATACASYETQALPIVTELRRLQSEVQQACSQNPSGQTCADLQQQQQASFNRYMALWNEAPTACRSRLAEPGSLI